MVKSKVVIIGSGSWGTAMAVHIASGLHQVTLVARSLESANDMQEQRENLTYLPRVKLAENITITSDLAKAVKQAKIIMLMVPSSSFSSCLEQIKPYMSKNSLLCWGTKGMRNLANKPVFLHKVVRDILGENQATAVIGGPSFAKEVAQLAPTAVVIASNQQNTCQSLVEILHHGSMRCYYSSDVLGVEFCGVIKNVLAVASGISDGLGLGANTRSALITRGLFEMCQLGRAMGVNLETLMGLSGVGDVVLSCTSDLSRNRRLGLGLGRSQPLKQILQEIGQVVESMANIETLLELAKQYQTSLPITEQVFCVISGKSSPQQALNSLLARQPKAEFKGGF